jgi:hypothetical protein
MGINFPNAPTTNQLYPQPPVAGLPVYQWDGEKWTTQGASATKTPIYTDGSTAMVAQLTLVGDPVNPTDAADKHYVDSAPALHNVGRNLIHNSLFNIQQRGVGPWGTGYTADRWQLFTSTSACNVYVIAATDGDRGNIGDEAAASILEPQFSGTGGAGDYVIIGQAIENVRRLANKTVTLSFWANASAALKFGVSFDQIFGTGGSPSPAVQGNGSSVTLSGSWSRYSLTFAIPSIAGKVLGTNNDTRTQMYLWLSTGSSNSVRSGGVGVQSGTVNIWGVQLEVGSVATPLEKPDPQQDLAKCQRFYQTGYYQLYAYGTAGSVVMYNRTFVVALRTNNPVITSNNTTLANGTASIGVYGDGLQVGVTVTAAGMMQLAGIFTASADF